MVISAGLAAADTLPDGPGLLLEDRDGRVYVAVLGSEGIVARNASDDADTWEVVAEGRVQGLQIAPDGDLWMARDDEILRYPRQGGEPVSRTPSFLVQGVAGTVAGDALGRCLVRRVRCRASGRRHVRGCAGLPIQVGDYANVRRSLRQCVGYC